jgi:hypothetical protein
MTNLKPDLCLDTKVYIEKKAKLLGFPDDEELNGWIDTFKELADLSEQDIDFRKLDQQALELFVRTVGVSPIEATLMGKEDYLVVPDESGASNDIPDNDDSGRGDININGRHTTVDDLLDDFDLFCREAIQIKYRPGMADHCQHGGYGPFLLTSAQKKIISIAIDLFFNKHVPVRMQILKSRQLGVTTLFLVFWIWICYQVEGYTAMFMIDKGPHLEEKRQQLIAWIETAAERFPALPTLKRRSSKVLELTNKSRILLESAESPNPGTSEMLQALHQSERPKWPVGRSTQVKASILPAIPVTKHTIIVDESTAEGFDDFQSDWKRIHEGQDEFSDVRVIPIFLPWYISEEYRKTPPKRAFHKGKFKWLNDDLEVCETDGEGNIVLTEEGFANKYGLAYDQVYWRRMKIKAPAPTGFGGDHIMFDQEYPTTPDHAWASIGIRYYPHSVLERIEAKEPCFIGRIEHTGQPITTLQLTSALKIDPNVVSEQYGPLRIWDMPEEGGRYFIGGDVSEGKLISNGAKTEGDLSVIWVLDEFGRDVAMFRDRIPPEEFAYYLILLGRFYNNARVNCERNKDGATVWAFFEPTGYPNVYYRDDTRGRVSDLAWSIVGPGARIPLMNLLRAAIREDPSRVRSRHLFDEMQSFVRKKNGKVEPSSGKHDDCLFARAHAEVCRVGLTGRMVESIPDPVPPPPPLDSMESIFESHGIEVW